jgi:hypothetical protein
MKKALLLILLLIPIAIAQDVIVSNTASWQNVYSAGLYSALQGKDFKFLVSAKHTEILINELPRPPLQVTVIESDRVPYVRRYANRLTTAGYTTDTLQISEEAGNLDIAKNLTNINNYIIVSPTFGYDAISATPYAVKTRAYVLFASAENINQITEFLDSKTPSSVTLFGDVDPEVIQVLSKYNPRIIDEGNRFSNNIAIAEEMRKLTNSEQAILTNGEFLENDVFFAGTTGQPLVFIGQDRIPKASETYVKTAPYKVFVVLGNNLFGSAQLVKESTGKPVIIKFAKGTTDAGGYKNVQGLDIFTTPQLELLLALDSIYYNADQKRVDMTLRNEKAARTYTQNSIIVQDENTPLVTLGDETGATLSGFEIRTISHFEDLSEHTTKNLTAQIVIPYGESDDSIEKAITATLPLPVVFEKDICSVEIKKAAYDDETQRFKITLETDKPCYSRITLNNLMVNDTPTNIQSETTYIEKTTIVEIKQRMDVVDRADNPEITVTARFGNQQNILIREITKTFPFRLEGSISTPIMIGSAAIVLLAIIIILALWKRKRRSH